MWYIRNAHSSGQIASGDIIWQQSDVADFSWFYELKAFKVTGITKPVLAVRDTRSTNSTVFYFKSAAYFSNIKPDGQLDGAAIFASATEIGSLDAQPVSNTLSGAVPLWMDSNAKLVASAPTTGTLDIPIPTGGTIVITTQPQYGTVSLVNGAIQYTATNGYAGADSFAYDIKGQSGTVIGSGSCSFSTSAATVTATPVFANAVIDITGDIRVNCEAGSAVTLYKNTDTNIVETKTDTGSVGYVLFTGIVRVQDDTFKAKAQKSGKDLSAFTIIATIKRKPTVKTGVSKQVQAGGTVSIAISDLINDAGNATFF